MHTSNVNKGVILLSLLLLALQQPTESRAGPRRPLRPWKPSPPPAPTTGTPLLLVTRGGGGGGDLAGPRRFVPRDHHDDHGGLPLSGGAVPSLWPSSSTATDSPDGRGVLTRVAIEWVRACGVPLLLTGINIAAFILNQRGSFPVEDEEMQGTKVLEENQWHRLVTRCASCKVRVAFRTCHVSA